MSDIPGVGGYEPASSPAERRAQFDLRRRIAAADALIATNTADIATNTADIATNTADIATNTADIATNTADIATNTTQLADLPMMIQHGVESGTTSAFGQLTATFPESFANTSYTVVATCLEHNSTVQTTAQVQNRAVGSVTFRILSDDNRDDSASRTVHWVAIGDPA